jgi:tetratricopeptide (TPR) repeat protein
LIAGLKAPKLQLMEPGPRSLALSRRLLAAAGCSALLGCAGIQPVAHVHAANLTGTAGAERALSLGDPVQAIEILERVRQSDSSHAYAQELLTFAHKQATDVVHAWVKEIEGLLWEQRFREARERSVYIQDNFPLTDADRVKVTQQINDAEQGLTEAAANLEEVDKQTEDLLAHNDIKGALQTLAEGYALAKEVCPEQLFARERMVLVTRMRLPKDIEFNFSGNTPFDLGTERRQKAAAKTVKKRKPGEKPETAADTAGAEPTDGEGPPRVDDLLQRASRFVQRKVYFNAVAAYLRVLDLEPDNSAAKNALATLEPQRQQLVRDLLDQANAHYLKQDLAGAEPYFRRVLLIDHRNEQAQQGLQMYQNLQRIQKESRGPGR